MHGVVLRKGDLAAAEAWLRCDRRRLVTSSVLLSSIRCQASRRGWHQANSEDAEARFDVFEDRTRSLSQEYDHTLCQCGAVQPESDILEELGDMKGRNKRDSMCRQNHLPHYTTKNTNHQ